MEFLATLFVLAIAVGGTISLPTNSNKPTELKSNLNYASRLSQLIATNLLKDSMEIDGNNVYSPLGVATILAVLGEASEGETYKEFITALEAPPSKLDLRDSFKAVLNRLQTSTTISGCPSFKTWFYIYRNNSAREEFKQILSNYYSIEVKDINRSQYNWDEPITSSSSSSSVNISNSKDVIGFETLKKLNNDQKAGEEQDIADIADIEANKEASKFDKFVDDKQYVEAPLIKEEIAREKLQQQQNEQSKTPAIETETATATQKDDGKEVINILEADDPAKMSMAEADQTNNVRENETVQDEEKIDAIRKDFSAIERQQENQSEPQQQQKREQQEPIDGESNEPQKVTIPLQKLEDAGSEIMQALESHFTSRRISGARSLFGKDDIASALSANSIYGKDAGSRTKMLLFNGLYYRGNWAYPFQELRSEPNEIFYLSSDQSMQTPMMHARGKYFVANLEALNACAVAFPYENKRYSLLVVMPKDIEGLHNLVKNLDMNIFSSFKDMAKEKEIYVSLPKFQTEETSRSEAMLKTLGLNRIFKQGSANFSLLSEDPDLHVDEIVQFVSVRVDEGGSVESGLSASNSMSRTLPEDEEERIKIDRPFLYFVVDTEQDLVIVSGKISVPKFKANLGFDINVEYTQS